jgi:hypothetical protein
MLRLSGCIFSVSTYLSILKFNIDLQQQIKTRKNREDLDAKWKQHRETKASSSKSSPPTQIKDKS